jgi:Kdo2-lipid IVA lauroyltransferase/acyltransferase
MNALGGLQVVQFNSHRKLNYTCMLIFILKLAAKLPLSWLRAMGSGVGFLVWYISHRSSEAVTQNLAQSKLMIEPQIALKANVRGLFEMVWVWFNPISKVAQRCTVLDVAIYKALDGAQATILLTPHLGCFEALAKWITLQTPLTAMYRRPSKPWMAALVEAARISPRLTMAPADASGVRIALKTLKQSGVLGILPDQVPKQGEGIWLPWFGRDAYTITLPAKLQIAVQARVYVVAALPNTGGWDIVCEHVDVPHGLDSRALTLHINQALERMVLRDPLHYAWSYKRYKGSAT